MNGVMTSSMIQVSVREGRLVTDRLLLTLGIPSGYVIAVRECVLVSQSAGLGGFARLAADRTSLATPFVDTMKRSRDGSAIVCEAGGSHAWIVLPTIVDLAVAAARKAGPSELHVRNVRASREMACVTHLAARHGVLAEATIANTVDDHPGELRLAVRNTSRPRMFESRYPLLAHALVHGFEVDRELWRSLYDLSNGALVADSVQSRRHAGPVIVLDDGTVVGRPPADDDFDPAMLLSITKIDKGPA